jgi:hypothetical protein
MNGEIIDYTDEEIAERESLDDRDHLVDLGLWEPERIGAPDLDPGDGPEPASFIAQNRVWS